MSFWPTNCGTGLEFIAQLLSHLMVSWRTSKKKESRWCIFFCSFFFQVVIPPNTNRESKSCKPRRTPGGAGVRITCLGPGGLRESLRRQTKKATAAAPAEAQRPGWSWDEERVLNSTSLVAGDSWMDGGAADGVHLF